MLRLDWQSTSRWLQNRLVVNMSGISPRDQLCRQIRTLKVTAWHDTSNQNVIVEATCASQQTSTVSDDMSDKPSQHLWLVDWLDRWQFRVGDASNPLQTDDRLTVNISTGGWLKEALKSINAPSQSIYCSVKITTSQIQGTHYQELDHKTELSK